MKTQTFQIVMLPSQKASNIYLINRTNKLGYTTGNNPEDLSQFPHQTATQNQHLYILSNDKIKEGDWCYATQGNEIWQWTYNGQPSAECFAKKIIVTTDKSLILHDNSKNNKCFGTQLSGKCTHILPSLPESFIQAYIKAYNDGKPITEVDLEMEFRREEMRGSIDKHLWFIKTRPDNTVIIHPSKTYTRDEIRVLLRKYHDDMSKSFGGNTSDLNNWIKENL